MSRAGARRVKVGSHAWKHEVVCDGCGRTQMNPHYSEVPSDDRDERYVAPCRCGCETATYAHPLPDITILVEVGPPRPRSLPERAVEVRSKPRLRLVE